MRPIRSPAEDADTTTGASPGADGLAGQVADSAVEAVTAIEWESWSGLSPPGTTREGNDGESRSRSLCTSPSGDHLASARPPLEAKCLRSSQQQKEQPVHYLISDK